MTIKSYYNPDEDLFIHKAKGDLGVEEILQALENFYLSQEKCNRVLWDGREATIRSVSQTDLQRIAIYPGKFNQSDRKATGKRAVVVASDLDFGLGRIIEILKSQFSQHFQHEVKVFRNYDQAIEWLRSDS
ncbi:MAG: hypothetical protein ACLFUS_13585 [Candidatus Sumerlaeia bacterium]